MNETNFFVNKPPNKFVKIELEQREYIEENTQTFSGHKNILNWGVKLNFDRF